MEDKKSIVKIYTSAYGICVYASFIALAIVCFLFGIFLVPDAEGFAFLLFGLFFFLFSFWLLHLKYMNYITLTDKNVSTKKQTFSWNEVYITMSYYILFKSISRQEYYIFFDDHYLSKDEMYSRRVKKNAFYIMVTPKKLEQILQNYNKKIQLWDRIPLDRKGKSLYDKVYEYNQTLKENQKND